MIIVMNLSILSCGGRQRQGKVLTLLPCSQTLYFLFNARRALPWVPETFLARFPVSVNTENSRRTQEPLRASFSRFFTAFKQSETTCFNKHATPNVRVSSLFDPCSAKESLSIVEKKFQCYLVREKVYKRETPDACYFRCKHVWQLHRHVITSAQSKVMYSFGFNTNK